MLTLDQIKPEAERLFGAPLQMAFKQEGGFDMLVMQAPATITHGIDTDLKPGDLSLSLEQFSARILAPAAQLLRNRVSHA